MPNYNRAIIVGHIGQKPEIRATQSGKNVATFSVATTDGSGDNKKTQWHKIVAWEKLAEIIEKYTDKGSAIMVEGRITYRDYVDNDNQKRFVTEIIATNIVLLGGGEKKKENSPADDRPPEW